MSSKTLMPSNMETLLLAFTSALACLSWLGWFEFVQSVSFISAQHSWKVMLLFFWWDFWSTRYFREVWKQVYQTVGCFCPAEPPSSPGINSYFLVFEQQHFRVFPHPLLLSREACCCRTVCWARDSQNDREACGSDSWDKKKWGKRSTGCWTKLSWFKLEKHTF